MEGKGWVNAEDLQLGDDIRKADSSTGEVESITTEQTSQEMYNLTVDEAHTFFVGDGQWLVHNCAAYDNLKQSIIKNLKLSQQADKLDELIGITFTRFKSLCDACAIANGANLYPGYTKGVIDLDGEHRVLGVLIDGELMIVDTSLFGSGTIGASGLETFEDYLDLWNSAASNEMNHMPINPRLTVWDKEYLSYVLQLLSGGWHR